MDIRRSDVLAGMALIGVVALGVVGHAQTTATYADRARLATQPDFVGRVQIASIVGAVTVLQEDPETADHAVRLRLAAAVLREPEFIARRLTLVFAAVVPAEVTDGDVSTSLTDAQLQALIAQRWTTFAKAIMGESTSAEASLQPVPTNGEEP